MERTTIRLGGIEVNSSVMNASGPRSAERGEIYELSAVHRGAVVFKSCNHRGPRAARESQEQRASSTSRRSRATCARAVRSIVGSVVGNTEDEIVSVATDARSRGREHPRTQPRRRLRDELGRAVRFVRAAQGAGRTRARRDLGGAGGEASAERPALHAPRDRRPDEVAASIDPRVRERFAEGPRNRHQDRRGQGRRSRALAGAMRTFARPNRCSISSRSEASTRDATPTSRISPARRRCRSVRR